MDTNKYREIKNYSLFEIEKCEIKFFNNTSHKTKECLLIIFYWESILDAILLLAEQ